MKRMALTRHAVALLVAALLVAPGADALAQDMRQEAGAQPGADALQPGATGATGATGADDPTAVPQKGIAATCVMARLLSTPQPGAKVLMTYYPGVRVQVVRRAGAQYVQVNVGNRPGTLTGYMRADELAYTELGVRGVQSVNVTCAKSAGEAVYSYMDALSENLGQLLGDSRVLGVSEDGWLHVCRGVGYVDDATGFVYRGPDSSGMSLSLAPYVFTELTEDEVSYEEIVAFAKRQILADGQLANGTATPVTLEGMEACEARLRVAYYRGEPLTCTVTFHDASGEIYTVICCYVDGNRIVAYDYGNG